jgi:hypothetical protein
VLPDQLVERARLAALRPCHERLRAAFVERGSGIPGRVPIFVHGIPLYPLEVRIRVHR